MEGILEVKDGEHVSPALTHQDILYPGQGVGVRDRGLI